MGKAGFCLLAAGALAFGSAIAADARRAMPVVSDEAITRPGMPRTLEDYQFFIHADAQMPTMGVEPYSLNTPLYSDGADKLRFVYIPAGKQAIADGEGLLQFPVGSALIKTFAFGEGEDRRLIETRVLLHREDGWIALPYRWNEEQTEAKLALVGARLEIDTPDHGTISYRIPNKNQCKQCHSIDGTLVPIGPKARNLSHEWLDHRVATGQLDTRPEHSDILPDWTQRDHAPADQAARAYLDVNCAHCHRPGGTASNSGLDLRWEQQDLTAIGIMKRPVAAGRGSGGLNFSILPADPSRSIMVHRMRSEDPGVAMPELGKSTVDEDGVAIVERWIAEMK
ncbi:hypothetical protein GRI41_02335 [Altererythrobacter aquaemixtae]|uniref:Cytochrome c domain-containing protein n=2 Tax=Pontixanthobacter aquaemixtae TaxID=1958940 RepID=A0A844ZMN4_9SPHN|nr:hypothetical protein [Pontixanthobacter aquaemixtae]